MRFLYGSILVLLLGCATANQSRQEVQAEVDCIKRFKPSFKSDLYNASVDVVGKHLSGLVLFKIMPDSSIRVVFTNEAGVKFFDFGFQRDGNFTAYHVMKKLNRKPVVKTLRSDFELVIMKYIEEQIPHVYLQGDNLEFAFAKDNEVKNVIADRNCHTLIRLEKGTKEKINTLAHLYNKGKQTPDSILIEHLNFNMKIKLKRLERL